MATMLAICKQSASEANVECCVAQSRRLTHTAQGSIITLQEHWPGYRAWCATPASKHSNKGGDEPPATIGCLVNALKQDAGSSNTGSNFQSPSFCFDSLVPSLTSLSLVQMQIGSVSWCLV